MDYNFLIPIGKRIAEIRHSHNLTQEEVADKLGVTPKHISHVECGISSLSLKHLITFCNVFHCSLDYVIFGQKEDSVLSKLPKEVVNILYTGDEQEIERIKRYLEMYIELKEEQD